MTANYITFNKQDILHFQIGFPSELFSILACDLQLQELDQDAHKVF